MSAAMNPAAVAKAIAELRERAAILLVEGADYPIKARGVAFADARFMQRVADQLEAVEADPLRGLPEATEGDTGE